MTISLPETLNQMIGLPCSSVKLILDKGLRIGLGKQIFHHRTKLQNKDVFYGEWDLIAQFCSWRVLKDSKIVCSAYDGEEFSEPIVKSLLVGNLKNIIQESLFDLSFLFDNGVKLELWGISDKTEDYALEVFCPNNIVFEFIAGHGWREKDSTSIECFTKEDELLSYHSEKFDLRWNEAVSKGEDQNPCKKCAYYLPIAGRFYFWDYGLCSNEDSSYDGKLVAVKSGCEAFSTIIK